MGRGGAPYRMSVCLSEDKDLPPPQGMWPQVILATSQPGGVGSDVLLRAQCWAWLWAIQHWALSVPFEEEKSQLSTLLIPTPTTIVHRDPQQAMR